MTAGDLRKLVYQGCFGGDHLLRDPSAFARALAEEWDGVISLGSREMALQPVHPSGRVARLHLGPCKAMGLSCAEMTRLLVDQPLKRGRQDAYEWAWAAVLHSARMGEIPFSVGELTDVELSGQIGHHSANYGPAAYRILNDTGYPATRELLCRAGILR